MKNLFINIFHEDDLSALEMQEILAGSAGTNDCACNGGSTLCLCNVTITYCTCNTITSKESEDPEQ